MEMRAGAAVGRQRVHPTGDPTAAQSAIRDLFPWVNQLAKRLQSDMRYSYERYAGQKKTSIQASVTKLNIPALRSQAGIDNLQFTAPAYGAIPPTSIVLTPGASRLTVTLTMPNTPVGWDATFIQGWALPQQSPYGAWSGVFRTGFAAPPSTSFNINGLTTGTLYVVGAAIWWFHPAYADIISATVNATGTPL